MALIDARTVSVSLLPRNGAVFRGTWRPSQGPGARLAVPAAPAAPRNILVDPLDLN
ncbi:hypothetical protein ARGLB_037_00820 [Arthrobacter globiformis NBRC 12137]|uniref:Uncharacterized protein n=1 Tax=Arthrobacter globiformis (strain ATCC 8010 / DSM 20124 / JCM 1332 / NBRC 12137 / NCIMB 8907 / NRRL B-2979 / 168) TaxID=1077972 RepID=H0QKN2_ARTG1|nr:hypothetical protein ARGLB_037_00820 [Arthrobacter globiformis NBRC 12137]